MSLNRIDSPVPHCTLHAQQPVTLEWIPVRPLPEGARVELRADRMRGGYFWKCVHSEMDQAEMVWRWLKRPQASDLAGNPGRILFRARLASGVRKGIALRIRLRLIPPYIVSVPLELSLWADGGASRLNGKPVPEREPGASCAIPLRSGPVERLAAWCRPAPGPDGTVRALVAPQDRFANPSRFEQPVDCVLSWNGEERVETVSGPRILSLPAPRQDVERLVVRVPLDALALSENIDNAVRDGSLFLVTGNPVWARSVEGRRAAFGEMHWHTGLSGDGQGAPEDAFARARDDMNLDFAAPSDHSPDAGSWKRTVSAVDAAHEPGFFATFFGWERSTRRGHENYYFTTPDHPMCCHGRHAPVFSDKTGLHGAGRAALLAEPDYLCVPHHTNSEAETLTAEGVPYWHPYPWGDPEPALRLAEIMQVRGNQERNQYPDAWMGWHQNNGASLQDALARGHKLGFTGGTDNHMAWPGRAWEPAEANLLGGNSPVHSAILTGVWTEAVERRAVFGALRARRTWAVWNTRAILWFEINGAPMGGELRQPAGAALRARIRLSAQDSLQSVEIVSNGGAIWGRSFAGTDLDIEVPLGRVAGEAYFYLRARQRDGGLIYGSPVFLAVS